MPVRSVGESLFQAHRGGGELVVLSNTCLPRYLSCPIQVHLSCPTHIYLHVQCLSTSHVQYMPTSLSLMSNTCHLSCLILCMPTSPSLMSNTSLPLVSNTYQPHYLSYPIHAYLTIFHVQYIPTSPSTVSCPIHADVTISHGKYKLTSCV